MMQKKNLPKNHFLYQKEFNTNQNNFFHSLYEVEYFLDHFSLFLKASKIYKILKTKIF